MRMSLLAHIRRIDFIPQSVSVFPLCKARLQNLLILQISDVWRDEISNSINIRNIDRGNNVRVKMQNIRLALFY